MQIFKLSGQFKKMELPNFAMKYCPVLVSSGYDESGVVKCMQSTKSRHISWSISYCQRLINQNTFRFGAGAGRSRDVLGSMLWPVLASPKLKASKTVKYYKILDITRLTTFTTLDTQLDISPFLLQTLFSAYKIRKILLCDRCLCN